MQYINMFMKIFVLTLALFLVMGQMIAQRPNRPSDINGALMVEGNQMVNTAGIPPQLRGISLSWSVWGGKKYYNPEVVGWLTRDFKISLLRASMAVQPQGGYLTNREEQMKLMLAVIDKAISEGIYVLIDWHDHNAEQHLEESKAFFAVMAKKYAGVPNVIYEIFNEPARQSWEVVKNYSVEVIKTIRMFDATNIIVVGSPKWDQDVDVAAADPIRGFGNLVYSFHFYASDPNHQEKLRSKAEMAMRKGLALLVTEWGAGESNGNGLFDRAKTALWMDWMEKNQLSWVNWNLTDKAETTALLVPGAPAEGGWTLDLLTESGKYIREQLLKLNK
jgi:endoglucanase